MLSNPKLAKFGLSHGCLLFMASHVDHLDDTFCYSRLTRTYTIYGNRVRRSELQRKQKEYRVVEANLRRRGRLENQDPFEWHFEYAVVSMNPFFDQRQQLIAHHLSFRRLGLSGVSPFQRVLSDYIIDG